MVLMRVSNALYPPSIYDIVITVKENTGGKIMAVSNVKVVFPENIQNIWEIVTNVKNCAWRSDLSKTDILNEKQFIEYTKDGFATTFTITLTEPCKRWEFDLENKNIKGHWIGIFTQKGKQTEIEFTENVTAKKFFMKPFVQSFLKKQQSLYISDLKKALQQ